MMSESPCRDTCPGRSYDPYEKGPYCTNQPIDDEVEYQYACGPYARYLGQQEGYAKGAWDVVDRLFDVDEDFDTAEALSGWLTTRGIRRLE